MTEVEGGEVVLVVPVVVVDVGPSDEAALEVPRTATPLMDRSTTDGQSTGFMEEANANIHFAFVSANCLLNASKFGSAGLAVVQELEHVLILSRVCFTYLHQTVSVNSRIGPGGQQEELFRQVNKDMIYDIQINVYVEFELREQWERGLFPRVYLLDDREVPQSRK